MGSFKARPTMYKGTLMRSRLEAGFAAWLDDWELEWQYEPHAFGGADGQYLPDFKLSNFHTTWAGVTDAYIEVKPDSFWQADTEALEPMVFLDRCASILGANSDAPFIVASPRSVTVVEYDQYAGMHWPTECHWCLFGPGQIGLAVKVADHATPWYGQWWKGTA